jgi:ABC-type Fe3+-hydroxamate transport system substrate-binding protein
MAPRVVSLVPCLTETVASLGLGPDRLLGRTDYCAEPAAWVARVPAVGGPKTPDLERVEALAPELVLVDPEENRLEDARALEAAGLSLWVARVDAPESVPRMLRDLGDVLGLSAAAGAMADRLDERLAREGPPEPAGLALTLVWWDPPMVVGPDRYAAGLLRRLGWDTPAVGEGPYPAMSWATVRAAPFDRLLLPSEPYAFSPTQAARFDRELGPASDGRRRVLRVDGRDLFWYGARTEAALERIAAAVPPPRQA